MPFSADKLIELICELEPDASSKADDADHTIFWLVTADQFAKHGITCEMARQKALTIIDEGSDTKMMTELGMDKGDLKKRLKMLEKLKERLSSTDKPRSRSVLKKPQEYVMEVGDVYVYPTADGDCINPYMRAAGLDKDWHQDSWSATIIVERGRVFDFLAWYRPLTVLDAFKTEPNLTSLRKARWLMRRVGTMTENTWHTCS